MKIQTNIQIDIEIAIQIQIKRQLLVCTQGYCALHYFALALTIGILFGIYSSVFVAAAVGMWLGIRREDLIKTKPTDGSDDPNDPNAGAVV